MSNILLAYNNRADAASFAGGSWVASGSVALANLGTKDIGELARSSSAAVTSTRFRFDIAASRTLRTLSLLNHNLSTAATVRMRAGRAVFDVDWASYTAEDRATFSGGAGGTRVTSAGLVATATTPRINHHPVSLAVLGLLLEEQRTNLITNNRDWSTGLFLATASTVTPATGGLCATRISFTASASALTVKYNTTGNAATQYACTVRLKSASFSSCILSLRNTAQTIAIQYTVNLSAATLTDISYGSPTSKLTPGIKLVGGGEYEVTIGGVLNSGGGSETLGLYVYNPGSTAGTIDVGPGTFEAGSFATSEAPTAGSQVTRTADSVTVTGSSFTGIHSATAGALYAEFNLLAATGTQPIVCLDDNTANERIELYVTGTTLKFRVIDGGATQCDITIGTVAAGTFYKAAVAWQANDFAGCLSGGTVATDSAGTLPTVDRMRIGSDQAGNVQNGHQKRTARFPERLTNAELQTITTTGIDALGYDSGWVNALRFSFIGDTPTNWGEQYPVMFAFDAITARYGTLEINDTANTAGYVQAGRLFVGTGFQPEHNAEYGRQRGRTDLSSSVTSISGKKYSTARRRPRTVDMRFPVLSAAEANHLDEMADAVGTTEEVLYVPDPADMALSQRQGFLAHLRELGALEDSFYENVATPYRLEEKL